MSKRGFIRGARKPPPSVPPVRVAVAPPLALPEREPRNILLMIALPALLVGIIGTLVVMYTSGVRSPQPAVRARGSAETRHRYRWATNVGAPPGRPGFPRRPPRDRDSADQRLGG